MDNMQIHFSRHTSLIVVLLLAIAPPSCTCGNSGLDMTPLPGTVFYTQDHLGGPVVLTDEHGNVIGEENRGPWGDKITGTDEARQFADAEWDEEAGLYYMNGRYYDPKLGRFLTVDPAALRPTPKQAETTIKDPQALNPYSYARNSPASYIDPSGEDAILLYGQGPGFPGGKGGVPADQFELGAKKGADSIVEEHNKGAVIVKPFDSAYPDKLSNFKNANIDEMVVYVHGSENGTLGPWGAHGHRLNPRELAGFIRTLKGIEHLKFFACNSYTSGFAKQVKEELACRGSSGGPGCTPYPLKDIRAMEGEGKIDLPNYKGDTVDFKTPLRKIPENEIGLSRKNEVNITPPTGHE